MHIKTILQHVDHTILSPMATWKEVKIACEEAQWADAASVCIPPCFVKQAAAHLHGTVPVCTVVGFPHGNVPSEGKVFEAEYALQAGAAEVDMVINIGMVKDEHWDSLLAELQAIREATQGAVLKVIVETCLLTKAEKKTLCHLVSEAGADYIKTSTGFSSGGAMLADVLLFRAHLAPQVRIKASGGIRSLEAAQAFLLAGADRIGSSALIPLAKQQNR